MCLEVKKDKRNNGFFFRKSPYGLEITKAKRLALMDISKYISEYSDLGEINYLPIERKVLYSTKNNKPFINI